MTSGSINFANVGVVAIGRNEGTRLQACLHSIGEIVPRVVYVDSGSSDSSVAFARAFGAEVVELDLHVPFTAARARNEGFDRLIGLFPHLSAVFFIDGDCEVESGWIAAGIQFLEAHGHVAAVCGIRRERFPDASPYNRLCDIEWRSPPYGEAKYCGGDVIIRVGAFRQVNGYLPGLICGEEPDMCIRLRKLGWQIWHLNQPMTIHDAAIQRFAQWWKRARRAGYAYAQGALNHGAAPEYHWVAEARRAWLWGLILPVLAGVLLAVDWHLSVAVAALYAVQFARLYRQHHAPERSKALWAGAMIVGKFAEMLGQCQFFLDRLRGRNAMLIEYK